MDHELYARVYLDRDDADRFRAFFTAFLNAVTPEQIAELQSKAYAGLNSEKVKTLDDIRKIIGKNHVN